MSEQLDLNALYCTDIKEKIVAIVRFGPSGFKTDGFRSGEYFQVTIDPAKVSPSGEFIRFGDSPGDEIVGWQRGKAISVVEILGKWEGNAPPTLEYGRQESILMLLAKQSIEV